MPLLGRDFDEDGAFAAACPLFRNEPAIGELLLDAIGIRLGLVDLVHGHDDRHFGGLGVIDGFERLGHHAVVRGHHDDDDVRHLGAAGTHAGECLVARRVEEDDLAAGSRRAFLGEANLVGADVLGDAAGFAGGNVGFADGIEQRGLAVIDVAHDGDHGCTRYLELAGIFGFEHFFDGLVRQFFFVADDGGAGAELGGDVLHHLGVERLVHGDEDAAHEQRRDQVLGANFELLGQVLHADAFGHRDLAGDGQRLVAEVCAAPPKRGGGTKPFIGPSLVLGYCCPPRRPRFCAARCGRGASPVGGAPPGTGAWTAKATGTRWRRIRGARQSRDGRRVAPGPPGPANPPGVVRVGCLGRGPPGNWPWPGAAGRAVAGSRRERLAGRRSKMGLPRWMPAPCGAAGGGALASHDGRLVDRARTGLRHHDAANWRSRRQAAGAFGNRRSRAVKLWCCSGSRLRRCCSHGRLQLFQEPESAGASISGGGAASHNRRGRGRLQQPWE